MANNDLALANDPSPPAQSALDIEVHMPTKYEAEITVKQVYTRHKI